MSKIGTDCLLKLQYLFALLANKDKNLIGIEYETFIFISATITRYKKKLQLVNYFTAVAFN